MGLLDDFFDGALDKLLDIGLDYAGGGNKKTGKRQTVGESFTSRRIVYGEHLVPGTLAFADAGGGGYPKNNYLTLFYVLATQHSDFVKEVRFDDVPMMLGIENAYDHFNSFTWRDGASDSEKYLLGKSRIDARTSLCFQRASLGKEGYVRRGGAYQYKPNGTWTILGDEINGGIDDLLGSVSKDYLGMTVVTLRLQYSEALYPSGLPRVTFVLRGKRVFDPRTSTTVYSNNYALCVLDFLKTIVQIPDANINTQSFIDAANICDEDVPTVDGETEKRFTVNGILELDKTPLENLETLLKSGGGWLSYVQGQWSLFLPVYAAPILDLDNSDLVSAIRFRPKSSKQDRINVARSSYVSEQQDWERVEAPTIAIQDYIDNDGERLEGTFDFDLVTSGYQVQRLSRIKLEQSRYGVTLSATFKFKALKVTVGDRVTLTVSNFGWTSKIFQVISCEIDYERGVSLTLREDDSSIYAWTTGDAIPLQPPKALNLPDHSDIQAPSSLIVSEELYQTNNTREVKARAIIEWVPDDAGIYKFNVEIKATSETEWTPVVWRYLGSRAVVNDIAPDDYDVRVQSINDVGFSSDWYQVSTTILGKTASPPDLSNLFVDGGLLTWSYPDAPLDLAGFEVRVHDGTRNTWADAVPMHSGLISGSRFTLPNNTGGTKTFLVKAIDTSGNYSENAAIATIGLGDAETQNIILTEDYKADTWPGTITNGTISGSNEIEADATGTFYNPDTNAIFYNQNTASDFYEQEFKKLSYEFTYTVLAADVGSQLTIDATVTADSYQLEFIAPSTGGTIYSSFGGYIPRAEIGQYKFKLSIPSQFGATVPTVNALELNLDVPDITEAFEDLSISSSGTRLPITKTYRGIRHVTLTLQTDGSGAASLKVDDKDETLGPLIYAYNTSGTAVNTTIDAFIRGY